MTRKDYEALAAALKESHERPMRFVGIDSAHNQNYHRELALLRVQLSASIMAVCEVLRAENPRFDHCRFYEAAMPAEYAYDGDGDLTRVG